MQFKKFPRGFTGCAGLLAMFAAGAASAQTVQPVNADPTAPPTYDFVQQAGAMSYDGTSLTLSDANTGVLFFSDRPYRVGGQISNADFASGAMNCSSTARMAGRPWAGSSGILW